MGRDWNRTDTLILLALLLTVAVCSIDLKTIKLELPVYSVDNRE